MGVGVFDGTLVQHLLQRDLPGDEVEVVIVLARSPADEGVQLHHADVQQASHSHAQQFGCRLQQGIAIAEEADVRVLDFHQQVAEYVFQHLGGAALFEGSHDFGPAVVAHLINVGEKVQIHRDAVAQS